jgi:hypothetical protein
LAGLLTSPLRNNLLRTAAEAFGAILLIEGQDEAATAAAREQINQAIRQIQDYMSNLPKAVSRAPVLIELANSALEREKVLLWSMDLEPAPTAIPRAAVFYGQGRWIGPLMNGPEISEENLLMLFSIIGADCECGMDLAWTRGTPLPARWTDELHELAAGSLGFDPASPMFQIEASRILGRYARRLNLNPALAYTEESVELQLEPREPEPPAETAALQAAAPPPPARHASNVVADLPGPSPSLGLSAPLAEEASSFGVVIWSAGVVGGLAILALAGALILWWRRGGGN